jgi:murein DD-endopeptidase MepM/ murein hydrolase activator NlpD
MPNKGTDLYGLLPWLAVTMLGVGCAQEIPLPASVWNGSDIVLEVDERVVENVVPRRATLAGLLQAHAFDGPFVYHFVEAVRPVFDPRYIRAGNPYRLVVSNDGVLRRFEYHIDNDEYLRVDSVTDAEGSFEAERMLYVKERTEVAVRGLIDERNSSLSAALDDVGENVNLAILMAELFSGEIDFNNDLRRGDRFDVLFEKYYREDVFSDYGEIVAAEFYNDGRTVQAFKFVLPGDDEPLYYNEDGRSLKRLFLRSPFRFEPRVTSRFSYRRLHPILGTNRPHLGVDYGAPTGTQVIAVANGRVVSATTSGGSGNMVRLRHSNGYETYYLHLSRFGKDMHPGSRVVQGQTVGYVGSTGLATGPHLDYRIRKNGTFVNPLIEHRNFPPGDPIPEEHLPAFIEVRDRALGRLFSPHSLPRDLTLAAQ